MSVPFAQSAFVGGEFAPDLFGRQDLARTKVGASTMRNMFPKFSGGANSRAGTALTGFSKQTGRNYPPRLIGFQFNINQGLALEFGNFYMRVISNGGYVTEGPLPVLGITQANPAVVTTSSNGVLSATANLGAVTATYAPGDLITLAGGTGALPAILSVTTTELLSTVVANPGAGNFVPGDTINVSGGVQTVNAVLTVATTRVVAAAVVAGGSGGTDGQQIVTGTTGVGTSIFQALVVVAGGVITSVISIFTPGSYTTNPTNLAVEPVTGAGLTGATLSVIMGVDTVTVTTAGTFTTNPTNNVLIQSSSSGTGTLSTFNMSILGPRAVGVSSTGAYSVDPANPVAQDSSTGTGLGATFTVVFFAAQPYVNGDWVVLNGVAGMTEVNGQTYVVANATTTTFSLRDVYGNDIDSTAFFAYINGGTISRIYTVFSPYAEADLAWLKIAQANDVLSITCLNQDTSVAYQPQDLTRLGSINWTFTPVSPAATVGTPTGLVVGASSAGASTFGLIVTAVGLDGTESLPSVPAFAQNAVDIYATAGTISINWGAVPGAVSYNVYQAAISFSGPQPAGVPYGIVATGITGTAWQNSNVLPDYTRVPPTYNNPFIGPANYPSTVFYLQGRRGYANTLTQPDDYFLSQPFSFTNFNDRTPSISSDAIIDAPWAQQQNGIQFVVDMPGGGVVLTGVQAWQLTGQGGSSFNPQPITPTTQEAQPQAFNGCHNHIPPIRIDYDILYVQSKGFAVRDMSYNFYSNIYTGKDLTQNASHLFNFFQLQEWCYAEEPYKLVWAVRTDGALLSLTYVKPEQITESWARHDTQGSFVSICSIIEQPVDAVYVAVQRQLGANTAYLVERMDNRLWPSVDQAWCVDSGVALPQPQPQASLTIGTPLGALASAALTDPGNSNYSAATTGVVVDADGLGPGTGATVAVTVVGGVPSVTFPNPGTGYISPQVILTDPAGSEGGYGAVFNVVVTNTVTLKSSPGVFGIGNVGSVVRGGGGVALITGYTSPTQVTASMMVPFSNVIPTDNNSVSTTPATGYSPVQAGNWTMTAPVSTVSGLNHLAGMSVVGVADGVPIGPIVVSASGTAVLPNPASNVVLGLSFLPQLQSLYLDPQTNPTAQGRRKKIAAVTVRVVNSGAFEAGSNQTDGSTLSPPQINVKWNNMTPVPSLGPTPYGTTYQSLGTGDVRVPLTGGYNTKGQVAVQQPFPLPLNCLDFVMEDDEGDVVEVHFPKAQQQEQRQAA